MPFLNNTDLTEGDRLYEGQIANTEDATIRTGYNSDTSILIFGTGLVRGTEAGETQPLLLPVDANSVFRGVAVATDSFEKRAGFSLTSDDYMGYPVDWVVNYLIRGVIGVRVTTDVTTATTPHLIHTADSGEKKGWWRADANSSKAISISSARFLRAGTAGTVVPLALNLV